MFKTLVERLRERRVDGNRFSRAQSLEATRLTDAKRHIPQHADTDICASPNVDQHERRQAA